MARKQRPPERHARHCSRLMVQEPRPLKGRGEFALLQGDRHLNGTGGSPARCTRALPEGSTQRGRRWKPPAGAELLPQAPKSRSAQHVTEEPQPGRVHRGSRSDNEQPADQLLVSQPWRRRPARRPDSPAASGVVGYVEPRGCVRQDGVEASHRLQRAGLLQRAGESMTRRPPLCQGT